MYGRKKLGVLLTMVPATLIIFLIQSPFGGLICSQMLPSVQLPIAIFVLVYLTSSKKVMGKYANSKKGRSCFGRSERQLAFYRQFHPLVFS